VGNPTCTGPSCESRATAAGKLILFGEHAVVYGRPAIAIPLADLRATARVTALDPGTRPIIYAQDLGSVYTLSDPSAPEEGVALQTTVRNTLRALGVDQDRAPIRVSVSSQVPIARGMGSGTAVATAIVRALTAFYGKTLSNEQVSSLVFETEVILHGTPSGVDNTVVVYERPVYFVRGQIPQALTVGATLHLLIGDTGVPSKTGDVVSDVQLRWHTERIVYEDLFDGVTRVVHRVREALVSGNVPEIGRLMNQNQVLLQRMGVSGPALERLIGAARRAGALGAKLSGGGRGGVMIAAVDEEAVPRVRDALVAAGAAQVFATRLLSTERAAPGGDA